MPSYQKPLRPAAKPALGPEVIQSAMDKRPRLNANTRRATGNRAAAANLPGSPRVAPPPPPPGGMRRAPGAAVVDTMNPMPAELGGIDKPMPMIGDPLMGGGSGADPNGGPFTPGELALGNFRENIQGMSPQDVQLQTAGLPAPSGSQNPMFSANLPPEIMQRLQMLQSARGGGQGAPGVAGAAPGAPAASPPPALPDYYTPPQPRFGGGMGFQPSFDRRMAY